MFKVFHFELIYAIRSLNEVVELLDVICLGNLSLYC